MGWTTNLLVGLAEHLTANDIASWEPTGPYDPASTVAVITLKSLPDLPDKAIALSVYLDVGDQDSGGVIAAVQMLIRGTTDPASADDIADTVWALLHNAPGVVLGTGLNQVHTTLIYRRSSAPLAVDEAGRWMRSDNYYALAERPNSHWPD